MQNARLDEAQAGIKISGRNSNNLRYTDDIILMAKCEEELKSLLMKVKEEIEIGLKLNIQKAKIIASGPITSWQMMGKQWKQSIQFSSVAQSCQDSLWPRDCSSPSLLSITSSWSLLKLMSIEWVMPSSHLILCHPLLLLPSIFPSIRVFSNESVLHIRWPKCWSFSFNISPSNEYSGLISFRMNWLDSLQSKGLSRVFCNITVQKH